MKESEIRPAELFNRYLELSRRDAKRLLAQRSAFVEVDCPACGETRRTAGLEKLGFCYVLCRDCQSLYLSPRPNAAQLDDFYQAGEAVRFWSTHFFKQTAEARREKMFRPRAALVRDIADKASIPTDGVFVDVGAGYGIFLEEVAKLSRFGAVMGLEPSPELAAVSRSRGFEVVETTLEGVEPGGMRADLAACFEVLEHVFDPLLFLRGLRCLLKPGGLALLTTLTVSGFDIQVLWEHSKSVHPPHHINLLSVAGMERLAARAELDLLELETPGQLDLDIVANLARENPEIRLPRFVAQMVAQAGEPAGNDFQHFLARHRLSSHIRLVLRRPATP